RAQPAAAERLAAAVPRTTGGSAAGSARRELKGAVGLSPASPRVLGSAMRAAVTVHVDTSPDEVWAIVSDITKMGEYSPEVVEAEWLDGATGPALGARYRGHVKRNENWPFLYWTKCKITECVPGKVFEFAVVMRDRPVNTWRYEFRATDDGGTDGSES